MGAGGGMGGGGVGWEGVGVRGGRQIRDIYEQKWH